MDSKDDHEQEVAAGETDALTSTSSTRYDGARSRKSRWRTKSDGWRITLSGGTVLAWLVLLVNSVCSIVAAMRGEPDSAGLNGQRMLYEGDCGKVKQMNVGLHLLINVLSTLLLGASNFAMQVLSAPTRKDIDRAHAKRHWLDIGVLSLRNLKSISRRRVLLWALFGLSSVPLHLFFNSAIYSTAYSADYAVIMTTEAMIAANATSHSFNIVNLQAGDRDSNKTDVDSNQARRAEAVASDMYRLAIENSLQKLDVPSCIKRYATTFPNRQGSVILITKNETAAPYYTVQEAMQPLSARGNGCAAVSYQWICRQFRVPYWYLGCDDPCSEQVQWLKKEDWVPFGSKIEYCLSQELDQRCNLSVNLTIASIVLVVNFCKAALLLYLCFSSQGMPLLTLGDALSSFLTKNDPTTRGNCLTERWDYRDWPTLDAPCVKRYEGTSLILGKAIGRGRWYALAALYGGMLAICLYLFIYGIHGQVIAASQLLHLPLGAIDPNTFVEGWRVPGAGVAGLMSNTLIANLPQLLLSMIYFTYNGLFTTYVMSLEWNSYAAERKSLRVSDEPVGQQRTEHFLQLPYRWGIPLLTLSVLLHWLCSQSIYLVTMQFDHDSFVPEPLPNSYYWEYQKPDYSGGFHSSRRSLSNDQYFTCAYSPVAILCTICVAATMCLFAIWVGLQDYKNGGMPVVGSCSAAISASCHLSSRDSSNELIEPEERSLSGDTLDDDAEVSRVARGKVKWGAISGAGMYSHEITFQHFSWEGLHSHTLQPRHCSFSDKDVEEPEIGSFYA